MGQEAVWNKRDQMGFDLLKKAQTLCGILPLPFYHYDRVLEGIVCLYHSTGTLVSGAKFFLFLSCSFVRHQQMTPTK